MSGQASSPPRTDIPDVVVSPEVFLAMGREVLASQPFSILVGARLHALSAGECELH
ncbi:MAG: phenylacetic acid degradation protein, partial [Acidovorax sp.]|nr:phenylacetic acid degradation protein [Acidovorax sp.]